MAAYWLIVENGLLNVVRSSDMAGFEQNWLAGRFEELRDG